MNIVDLESFVAVVDSGSIVSAAAKLHLTQSAITRRLQNLESSLGVPLLDRQTRPMQLTEAGKAAYTSAKPVLSSVDGLRSAVVHNGEPSGDFSFGVARGLGDRALFAPIATLREQFPLIKLRAYSQWSESLIERVRARTLDVAVVLLSENVVPPPNMESELLGKHLFVVVGPKSSASSQTLMLKDLALKSWVVSPEGCSMRYAIESALSLQRLPFSMAVEAEGKELQLSLVAEGVGLGIVPLQVLKHSSYRKNISVLRIADFSPVQDLRIIRSKHINYEAKVVGALRKLFLQLL